MKTAAAIIDETIDVIRCLGRNKVSAEAIPAVRRMLVLASSQTHGAIARELIEVVWLLDSLSAAGDGAESAPVVQALLELSYVVDEQQAA